ncbi:MAG TPA: DUF2490 domain-containing protein [Bryobacteraceae bacterium]|nr:DUF2490 domain-containing protein [Bryobacteraceae bacterium]
MKKWLLAFGLLWVLPQPELRAADVESLHAFNVNFPIKPGWTIQLHTRVRTFEDLGAFNQFRVGPILMWQAAPRFTVLAGYYRIDQNTRVVHDSYYLNRAWWGGQYRVVERAKWSLDARSVVERFMSGHFDDYWRIRNRVMINRKTSIGTPYVSGEALRQEGIWYGRYTAGMQWHLQKDVTFGAGYEYRDAPRGQGSHIMATTLQWEAHRHVPPHVD